MDGLSFGQAIELAKVGAPIARKSWNGMFVFIRPGDYIEADMVERIKTIPPKVKALLNGGIEFTAYFCIFNSNGQIVNGWNPSQQDMTANDWFEVTNLIVMRNRWLYTIPMLGLVYAFDDGADAACIDDCDGERLVGRSPSGRRVPCFAVARPCGLAG